MTPIPRPNSTVQYCTFKSVLPQNHKILCYWVLYQSGFRGCGRSVMTRSIILNTISRVYGTIQLIVLTKIAIMAILILMLGQNAQSAYKKHEEYSAVS